MEISRELFDQQRRPRFGTANPERMHMAFWEWMILGDEPLTGGTGILGEHGFALRDGKLKSGHGPWRARDRFGVPVDRVAGPIWTFDRMGRTRTDLPDGRLVCVGGEHEDHYDPDFCIYNDVVVFTPAGEIEFYGYPRDVFPPTDFHSAALVGERIVLVGCLGYSEDCQPGRTPVFTLNPSDYRITPLETSGEGPGWVSKHEADLGADGAITVRGGQVIRDVNGHQRLRRNVEDYALDTRTWTWRRLTARNWRQFDVTRQDGKYFLRESDLEPDQLLPLRVADGPLPCEEFRCIRVAVRSVPIRIEAGLGAIEIMFEGDLPEEVVQDLVDQVRANAENAIGRPCIAEEV